MSSTSWEDFVAMSAAGAKPIDAMTRTRALIQSVSPPGHEEHQHSTPQPVHPVSSLWHSIDSNRKHRSKIPIPFLTPPLRSWDILRGADHHDPPSTSTFSNSFQRYHGNEGDADDDHDDNYDQVAQLHLHHASVFDTEADLDVLQPFQTQPILPPEHDELLEEIHQLSLASLSSSFSSSPNYNSQPQSASPTNPRAPSIPSSTSASTLIPTNLSEEQTRAITRCFTMHLLNVSSAVDGQQHQKNISIPPSLPIFPTRLDEKDWSCVLSQAMEYNAHDLRNLFTSINGVYALIATIPCMHFARVALHTIIPSLATHLRQIQKEHTSSLSPSPLTSCSSSFKRQIADFSQVVELVADTADVSHMDIVDVEQLFDMFRSLKLETVGAAAQAVLTQKMFSQES